MRIPSVILLASVLLFILSSYPAQAGKPPLDADSGTPGINNSNDSPDPDSGFQDRFPIEFGREYTYDFYLNGQNIGSNTFFIDRMPDNNILLTEDVDLTIHSDFGSDYREIINGTVTYTPEMDWLWCTRAYDFVTTVPNSPEINQHCDENTQHRENRVTYSSDKSGDYIVAMDDGYTEQDVPEDIGFIMNDSVAAWAMNLAMIDWDFNAGDPVTLPVWHNHYFYSVYHLTETDASVEVDTGGRVYDCREFSVQKEEGWIGTQASQTWSNTLGDVATMWVSSDGLLVKVETTYLMSIGYGMTITLR